MAIGVKKNFLAEVGVDALYTHEEVEGLRSINFGKSNLTKQKEGGTRPMLIGSLLGAVAIGLWVSRSLVVLGYLVGMAGLTCLDTGGRVALEPTPTPGDYQK
jgi:hypothetical protein